MAGRPPGLGPDCDPGGRRQARPRGALRRNLRPARARTPKSRRCRRCCAIATFFRSRTSSAGPRRSGVPGRSSIRPTPPSAAMSSARSWRLRCRSISTISCAKPASCLNGRTSCAASTASPEVRIRHRGADWLARTDAAPDVAAIFRAAHVALPPRARKARPPPSARSKPAPKRRGRPTRSATPT
jgi:hypothetical protein